jgi:uncharacterized delta-60 repeat protein
MAKSLMKGQMKDAPAFLRALHSKAERHSTGRADTPNSSFLDGTFGTNGTAFSFITGRDTTNALGQSVAMQKDGGIVVAGYCAVGPGSAFALVRYTPDGALDTTFGTGGIIRTIFSGGVGLDVARSVALQSDGKIIAAGSSANNGQGNTFALARYGPDGKLDSTFGSHGTVRAQVSGVQGANDVGSSVAVQPDGKIVVAGTSNNGFGVARFNASGSIDTTFGTHGASHTTIQGGDGIADPGQSVALQHDGKIVVAGSSYSFFGGGNAFAVARFDTNGVLDRTFGGNGTFRLPVGGYGPDAMGYFVAIQPDEKIVLAGYHNNDDGLGDKFGVYRCKANGTLDSTFGANGFVRNGINGDNGGGDRGYSVAVQPDGKLVVAGTSTYGSSTAFAAARYDTNGTLDTTFGTKGTLRRAIVGGDGTRDEAATVLVQPDGNIVLGGGSSGPSGEAFAITRVDSIGTPDTKFGVNGAARTELGGFIGPAVARSMALQSDGKIIVAGISNMIPNSSSFAVARFTSGGVLDHSFNAIGMTTTLIAGGTGKDIGAAVAVQSDGRIVVAGNSSGPGYSAIAAVRYNTNGSLDNTFGTGGTLMTPADGGSGSNTANAVAVQADGKIVIAGTSQNGSASGFLLNRLNTNGSLDNLFGTNGTVVTSVAGGSSQNFGSAVALQPDGKIVVAGGSTVGSTSTFAVARYNANGTLDNTFGQSGTITTSIDGSDRTGDDGSSVVLQPDGKIVVAGTCHVSSGSQFAVARFTSSGALDHSFGSNGSVRIRITGSDGTFDVCPAGALQPDGRIVVGGMSANGSNLRFAAARLTPDGLADSSWGSGGSAAIQINGALGADLGTTVAVQPNGKIVMAGSSIFYATTAFAIARFLPGSVPFASTVAAGSILTTSAALHGIVYPSGVSTTIRFIYGKAPGAYADSVNASPATVNGDTTTAVSAALTGLTGRTTYYFRVSATSQTPGNYYLSAEKSFTTLDPIPLPPTGISPLGSTGVARKATFLWHATSFAKTYRLQVGSDSAFTSVVFDTVLVDTSMTLSSPLASTSQYSWRVRATNSAGSSNYSPVLSFTTGTLLGVAATSGIPTEFALHQNFPNPFNPTTVIRFALPREVWVQVVVYNALGQRVATLVDDVRPAGTYDVRFDGRAVASGVLFFRMHAGDFVATKRMIVVK